MTLTEFAVAVGASVVEVTSYEHGSSIPSSEYVARACDLLSLEGEEREGLQRQSWLKTRTVRCLGYSEKKAKYVFGILRGINEMRISQVESMSAAIRRYRE